MSNELDYAQNTYPAQVHSMNFQEVTAHIEVADKKAEEANKELQEAEAVLKKAQQKFAHAHKYARLTRDFTKKALSASNPQKEAKIRESYRMKFGALSVSNATKQIAANSQSTSVPQPVVLQSKQEESRNKVQESIAAVENVMNVAKDLLKTNKVPENNTETNMVAITSGSVK